MGSKLVLSESVISELETISGSALLKDELMSQHTSFRIGGPADFFTTPKDAGSFAATIRWAYSKGIEYLVLGAGSNILVADFGIRGLVISTSSLNAWSVHEDTLTAAAGAFLPRISLCLADCGLSGFEEACGIPGSIGGALHMNAGAYGWNISHVTRRVFAIDRAGYEIVLDKQHMDFGTRTSALMKDGYIALSLEAELKGGDRDSIKARVATLLADRAFKQPLDMPSAGCAFRNPTGLGAGRLIDLCGLKGTTFGGAAVSTKHANFIINAAGAKASDVRALMDKIGHEVFAKYGERLEPEIRLVGDWHV